MEESNLDDLILSGIVEVKALGEDGKFLYGFTENAKDIAPEVMTKVEESFYSDLMYLWTKGFISMDVMSENPKIGLTEKALIPEEAKKLGPKYLMTLTVVINALKN